MKSQQVSDHHIHFYQTLFDSVEEIIEMPEYDRQLCFEFFEPVIISKSTIIEKAGKVPGHQYFNVSGQMRNIYLDSKGEEVTTDINNGPRFFTSYTHFMNRTFSNENIECITACELLRVKRDEDVVRTATAQGESRQLETLLDETGRLSG